MGSLFESSGEFDVKLKTQKKWTEIAWKSGVSLLFLMTLTFAFQNCGKAGFDSLDGGSLVDAQAVDPKLAGLPFPYDVSVNQIAFMSCPFEVASPTPETPALIESAGYFTWKAGAFDNNTANYPTLIYDLGIQTAGLQLRNEFKTAFKTVSQKEGYNETLKPTKFKEALMTLPGVAGSQLQLSFRQPNAELAKVLIGSEGIFPVKNFMTKISTDAIADSFDYKSLTGPFNYFRNATTPVEGSLEASLTSPWSMSYYNGGSLSGTYLTLGFSQPNSDLIAGAGDSQIFAKGFQAGFGPAYFVPAYQHPPLPNEYPVALTRLTEYDLSTSDPGQSWTCEQPFKIVKAADRFRTIYKANNFQLVPATIDNPLGCPGLMGPEEDFCPAPVAYQTDPSAQALFGKSLQYFRNLGSPVCPFNRQLNATQAASPTRSLHGRYCVEDYTLACPLESYAQLTASFQGKGLAVYYALRRFLPEDKWDINLSSRCIVPKTDSGSACYGDTARVVYDESFFNLADANPNYGMYQSCLQQGGECPAYLTLCLKK